MAHDKLLRGRKLVVTFAHQAPVDQGGGPSVYGAMGVKRKGMMETGRPTTLSMLKTGMTGRNDRFVFFTLHHHARNLTFLSGREIKLQ